MKIEFFYYNAQCPINEMNRNIIENFSKKYSVNYRMVDIDKERKEAETHLVFSPNTIIVNDTFRWNGPISNDILLEWYHGEFRKRQPYVRHGKKRIDGDLESLSIKSMEDTKTLCCMPSYQSCIEAKICWSEKMAKSIKGSYHYVDGKIVGGVEAIEAKHVPYPLNLPKESWFITCLFGSDDKFDYKSAPLDALESELTNEMVKEVYMVASEKVSFPNGPLAHLLEKGYECVRFLSEEPSDHARLFLIKKVLLR